MAMVTVEAHRRRVPVSRSVSRAPRCTGRDARATRAGRLLRATAARAAPPRRAPRTPAPAPRTSTRPLHASATSRAASGRHLPALKPYARSEYRYFLPGILWRRGEHAPRGGPVLRAASRISGISCVLPQPAICRDAGRGRARAARNRTAHTAHGGNVASDPHSSA